MSLEVYLEFGLSGEGTKLGMKHVQTDIYEQKSANLGPFNAGESVEKEHIIDINTKDGYTETDEKTYTKKEEGGYGLVEVEEEDGTTTVKSDLGTGVEVNAGIVGVEAEVEISIKKEKEKEDEKNENSGGQ